jgi:hypothetical protein
MGCKSSRKIYEIEEENTLSSETKELLEKYENIQKRRRHSDPIILKPIFKRRRRKRERHLSV